MLRSIWSISSLLIGMGTLLIGSGLLGMLIGLRGVYEGFSNFMIGLIMSGYYVGYVAGAWVCPILIRRVGHVRCFASFAALSAVLTLSFGMVIDPWAWLVLRVFNGLALMGIYMVIESWLNERSQSSPGNQGSIFAVYMIVNLVAVAAGQYLVTIHGATALESFVIAAILFSMGLLPIALTPVPQPLPIATPSLSLSALARKTPSGVAGALGSGLVQGVFWALTALYGRGLGFSDIEIANFTAAAIMGGAITQWPIGWLSDHSKDRREVLLAIAAGATLTLAAMSTLDLLLEDAVTANDYIAVAFLLGIFQFSIYGMAVAQTTDRFPASEALEATRGLLLLHGIGAAVGPLIGGLAMQLVGTRGFPQSMALMTAALGLFVWYRIYHDAPVPQEERMPFHPVSDHLSPVAMEMDPRADAPLADSTPDATEPGPSPEEAAAAAAEAVAMAQTVATEAVKTAGQAADAAVAEANAVAAQASDPQAGEPQAGEPQGPGPAAPRHDPAVGSVNDARPDQRPEGATDAAAPTASSPAPRSQAAPATVSPLPASDTSDTAASRS